MSLIVTIARYRAITGDVDTGSVLVSAKIEEATELLADALGREIAHDEHTETLWPTRDGYVWPSCTPIESATSWTVDGDGLRGSGPFATGTDMVWPGSITSSDVTYVGGWKERTANPGRYALPKHIEHDIAWAARALVDSGVASPFPAGAKSVQLGDAAITFGDDGAPGNGTGSVSWSRRTLRHRAGTVRGTGTRC